MNTQIDTLDVWLAAATSGLPEPAALKFRAEIADHAAEAQQRHIDAGMPPDEASRAALAGLGDASAVAKTLRDQHFSRGRYTRGALAVLALFAMTVAQSWLASLADTADTAGGLNPYRGWVWLAQLAVTLPASLLSIVVMRALLTFLREQHAVRIPRRGEQLLVAGLLAGLPYNLLVPLLVWGQNYGRGALFGQFDTPLTGAMFAALPALHALQLAGMLAAGGLAIALAAGQRRTIDLRRKPVHALLLYGCGLAGLAQVGVAGLMAAASTLNLPYPQNIPLLMATLAVSTVLSAASLVPPLPLMALLGIMGRPGAALPR